MTLFEPPKWYEGFLGPFFLPLFFGFFGFFWTFFDPLFQNLHRKSRFFYPPSKFDPSNLQASPLDDATTHRVDELSWGLPQTTAVCEELGASLLRLDIIRFYILFSILYS